MERKPVQTIDSVLLDELIGKARLSPRRRAILRLHDGDWEHAHRMINALSVGTYVRPHQHKDRHKGEGFILLRGRLAVLIFDDHGDVLIEQSGTLSAEAGCFGMDLAPGVWHSLVAIEDSVIYEVKGQPAGGYVQSLDKDFAPWAPEENSPEADEYCRFLHDVARAIWKPL
jgi:cupin fold WbuC family metalloprotein